MKPLKYIVGCLALILAGAFTSCSEVEEESVYANWQEKNEAYADSLLNAAGVNLFSTAADTLKVDAMPTGTLFGIQTRVSTTKQKHYVFCKKLSAFDAPHPIFTDQVSVFYCGSYITGTVFDSNFDGYVATSTGTLYPDEQLPAVYDSPLTGKVSGYIPGWITALQYMREGERWMLYVPYQSAYGSSSSSVMAYSALVFDVILNEIVD